MRYLKQKRAQLILAAFVLSSVLLLRFPGVDLYVSRIFYGQGFYLGEQWWTKLLNDGVGYFLAVSMTIVVSIYAFNRIAKRSIANVSGRTLLYLVFVLVLGAGLIVNTAFKDHFGRARPRDIEAFGGALQFTPAFIATTECRSNCSFSSGHGAGAFFAIALAMAFSRRRAALFAAVAYGCLVSVSRIVSGAHFLSDTVVSFFVMLLVADALYFLFFASEFYSERSDLVVDGPYAKAHEATHARVNLA
jgi:lipid A 4'-phosphatase